MSRAPISTFSSRVLDAIAEPAARATVLGSYELLAELGGSALCSVHRARSIVPGANRDEVALKRLRAEAVSSAGRAQLLREARVGLGVRAPNLVRVLALHDEPELYLVLEYIDGASLEQLLASAPCVGAARYVLPMFVDALHGLSALHQWKSEAGAPGFLVHQAPCLRHMLAGVDGVTRMIDLAHVHGALVGASDPVRPPATGQALAPEQFDATQGLDPRCDVFLMGVALHSALTRLGIFAEDPRWAALHAIADRARQPKRNARFWSADEMAYAVESAAREAGSFAAPHEVGAWVAKTRQAPVASSANASLPPRAPLALAVAPAWAPLATDAYHTSVDRDDADDQTLPVEELLTTLWQPPADLDVLIDPLYEAPARIPRATHAEASHAVATAVVARVPHVAPAVSAPTVLIRDDAAARPLRRLVAAAALAAAVSGALTLGLRGGSHTATASAATLELDSARPAPIAPPASAAAAPIATTSPSAPTKAAQTYASRTRAQAQRAVQHVVAPAPSAVAAAPTQATHEPDTTTAAPVLEPPTELPPNPYQ